jgi:hypothetical protein
MHSNRCLRGESPWALRLCCWCVLLILAAVRAVALEPTWDYTVQLSATVQLSPPQILLSWPQDTNGPVSYTVYRKAKADTSWGPGTLLPGTATNYTDTNVAVGSNYEYGVVKVVTWPVAYNGYGYIFSGIESPLVEDRGRLDPIVTNTCAAPLTNELALLQSDLAGDGWTVIRHDVDTNDSPADVRNLIIADYHTYPNVQAVFLFGHVPILHSGNLNYDGHESRPMPADAYYGDIDGDWSGSPDYLPSDVELMVGRVDMFNMVGTYAPVPWPSEIELLRNYLRKDHLWRQGLLPVSRLALMGDRRGGEGGLATAASGYRTFQPLLGPGSVVEAGADDGDPPNVRWGPMLGAGRYMWAYGNGAGSPDGISSLGTNGLYSELMSEDVVGQDQSAVFVMLFGSWFGNWDDTDDFMRAFLASPTLGLACCMSGVPHWFLHHMGLGETIGYSTRLTMNNSTLYQNQTNLFPRAIYIALMGDPTLRMDPVLPPGTLTGFAGGGGVNLSWPASPDTVLGYYVYRSDSPAGPYQRLTPSLVTATQFTDTSMTPTSHVYMVRALKLQTTPSGTYTNASQGVFITVDAANASAMRVWPSFTSGQLSLSWNSQSGQVYHVLATDDLRVPNWTDVSGSITASGPVTSWTTSDPGLRQQRFYRVLTP